MTFDAREISRHDGAPLECYEIAHGSSIWRLTSADSDAGWGGHAFTPTPITRGEIDLSSEDGQSTLEITLPRTHPIVALFIPGRPIHPVTLTLFAGHQDEAEWVIAWAGTLDQCSLKDSEATLTGMPAGRALRRTIPSTSFQRNCNWQLFTPPCGLSRANHACYAVIVSISDTLIEAAEFAAHSAGYFRLGEVVGPDDETIPATTSTGRFVTLQTPFHSLHVGDTVRAYPGCSHTTSACAVLGNDHFFGFPWIPGRNPYVDGAR
jgi:hypothetical protein